MLFQLPQTPFCPTCYHILGPASSGPGVSPWLFLGGYHSPGPQGYRANYLLMSTPTLCYCRLIILA